MKFIGSYNAYQEYVLWFSEGTGVNPNFDGDVGRWLDADTRMLHALQNLKGADAASPDLRKIPDDSFISVNQRFDSFLQGNGAK